MEAPTEERQFASYFLEKNEIVEESIRRDFSFLLSLSLSNVDLRKGRRTVTLVHILVFVINSVITLPLLTWTAFLLKDDLILFTSALHYALIGILAISYIVNLNIRAPAAFLVHYDHAVQFYVYDEPCRIAGVDALRKTMDREKRIVIIMPVLIVLAMIFFILSNTVDSYLGLRTAVTYRNGVNMRLIIPAYFPFDSHEGIGCWIANGLIFVQLIITGIAVSSTAYFYAVVFQRLILQFQILSLSISHIEKRANDLHVQQFGRRAQDVLTEQFEFCLIQCLKHNIQHYNVLKRHFSILEGAVHLVLLLTFITGSIIIGLSIVLASEESLTISNKLLMGIIFLGEVGNMFLTCFYAERLATQSRNLFLELYFIPWYNCGRKFKKLVFEFKELAANPLVFSGGGIMPVNLETFSSIINTAYSYYQFVSAI